MKKKGGRANSREIDYSRVAKMLLRNPFFTELSLQFAAQKCVAQSNDDRLSAKSCHYPCCSKNPEVN